MKPPQRVGGNLRLTAWRTRKLQAQPLKCGQAMTDHPRYEPVTGPPDTAHRHYHGGRLVGLVFRLIDRWRGGAGTAAVRAAPALDPSSGPIEIHERPPRQDPVAERSAADELLQAHARLT